MHWCAKPAKPAVYRRRSLQVIVKQELLNSVKQEQDRSINKKVSIG